MRVADYIAQRLARETDTVFMLAGGGAMFLNDAFGWCDGLKPVYCHHEQTCSMAAEAYARFGRRLGVANVTTGPGGINALNGVYGAWTDSLPVLIVSGQVKRKTTLRGTGQLGKLRQLGDQEVDIVSMARSITKMATFISEIEEVPFALEEAIDIAKDGRPGPVWLDIPIDIQASEIQPERFFICSRKKTVRDVDQVGAAASHVASLIQKAKRPVFLIGSAVRAAGALEKLKELARRLNIPICTAWTAIDAVSVDDQLYGERPGAVGTRAGNIVLQQSDLVIVLGSRLPIRQVSYNWENFAKNAIKVGVDIDAYELAKPMVSLDVLIQAEVSSFIETLFEKTTAESIISEDWLSRIKEIKEHLPPIDHDIRKKAHPEGCLNPYLFVEDLWGMLDDEEIIACADASASVIPFQIAPVKSTQRMFTNAGSASMGYELPAAIGAAFANCHKRILCIAGDGSLMLNIQELETIARYQLPIKVLILNNQGYLSIKLSQKGFFNRQKGAGPESDLGFLNFSSVAAAADLKFCRVKSINDYSKLAAFLSATGPGLAEILIDPEQSFQPKLGSYRNPDGSIQSNSLENMSPLISNDLLERLMGSSDDDK